MPSECAGQHSQDVARESGAPPPALSDRQCMALAQDGDTEAFGILYRRHRGAVNAVCRRFLGDPHTAEDAVQEVFARALKALPDSGPDMNVRSWLKRIARNLCIDLLRERRRRPESRLGAEDTLIVDHHTGDEFESCDTQQTALQLLRRLNERQGQVLLAHDGYEVPLRDLAAGLQTTEGSLAVMLHRARARARQVMSSPMGIAGPLTIMKRLSRWATRQSDTGGVGAAATAAVGTTAALALVLILPMTPAAPSVSAPTTAGDRAAIAEMASRTEDGVGTTDARRSDRQLEEVAADGAAAPRGTARSRHDDAAKPPPYVDMDSVDVPLVERRVGTRRPAGEPDYDYGVHAKVLDEEVQVGLETYDEPEFQKVDGTACRAAEAGNPVTYCHTDEP